MVLAEELKHALRTSKNLIEILRRRIKFNRLSFDAYLCFQNLKERLLDAQRNLGIKYDILFKPFLGFIFRTHKAATSTFALPERPITSSMCDLQQPLMPQTATLMRLLAPLALAEIITGFFHLSSDCRRNNSSIESSCSCGSKKGSSRIRFFFFICKCLCLVLLKFLVRNIFCLVRIILKIV